MGSRHAIAIDIGRQRVRAVAASRSGGQISLTGLLIDDVPSSVNSEDAVAVGRWLGERLRQARIGGGKATIALGREHVGLKRLTLPTAEPGELPDMTRLALLRELPVPGDDAVIDFVPVERGPTSTTVLAVAVPRPVIDFATVVAKQAGLRLDRIALRAMGAAALLHSLNGSRQQSAVSDRPSGARVRESTSATIEAGAGDLNPKSGIQNPKSALAIDVTGEGVEFCMVGPGGGIQFSRAAEVPQPQDQLAIADAVVTETRRTWMSYRSADESPEIDAAVLMGDHRVSAYAAGPLEEMMKIPVTVLQSHPRVDARGAGRDIDRLWPLAGLLLEPALKREMIDFSKPRRAPDLGARSRIRWLIAAGIAVVALLGAWTASNLDLNARVVLADSLEGQQREMSPAFMHYWRDRYKINHLKQWESAAVDWLGHASYLTSITPSPDQVVLDSWSGTLDARDVGYDPKARKWHVPLQMTIVIDGEARDRETADAFREALVQASLYTTSSTGADAKGGKRLPFGFTYRLRTTVDVPSPWPASPPVGAEAARPGVSVATAEGGS